MKNLKPFTRIVNCGYWCAVLFPQGQMFWKLEEPRDACVVTRKLWGKVKCLLNKTVGVNFFAIAALWGPGSEKWTSSTLKVSTSSKKPLSY